MAVLSEFKDLFYVLLIAVICLFIVAMIVHCNVHLKKQFKKAKGQYKCDLE